MKLFLRNYFYETIFTKLFLRNYFLLALITLLTLFSCVEKGTTDSNHPTTTTTLSIDYGISGNFYIALTNTALELIQKSDFGSQPNFSISPSLPNGLSLNVTSGNISGKPTTVSLPAPYTVTATKGGKVYTKTISLGVVPSRVWITNTNSLDPYSLTVYVVGGASQQNGVNWGSSNPSLATVNNGVIGFKPTTTGGTALVFATKNSYSNGVSFTVDKVKEVNGEKIITKGTNVGLIISSGTTTITNNQFQSQGLTRVMIPNSLTIIGHNAFTANRLSSVTIPNSVTSIGGSAFSDNQLSSVTIPNSVTSINNDAFFNNQLTNVVIPNNLTIIGHNLFSVNRLSSVTIPNSVTSIGTSAFSYNQLTSIIIPNNVTNINNDAFFNNQLTNVVIPNNITSIASATFRNNQLTKVVIPDSVTSIGNVAFKNNQLINVVIPNSVTNIGDGAFTSNPNLVEVSLKQSLYTKITNTRSTNAVFGTQVTNYIKRP